MSKRARIQAWLAATAVAISSVILTPTAAQAETSTIRVLSHNINGGQWNYGSPAALAPVNGQIDAFAPVDVVMLQEVCESQRASFQAAHPAWTVVFTPRRLHDRCDGVEDDRTSQYIGELVAIPRAASTTATYPLYGEGGFHLTCVGFVKGSREYLPCTTHLPPGDDAGPRAQRDAQLSQIRDHLRWSVNYGRGVILGGDFNTEPDDTLMAKVYRIRNNGTRTGDGDFFEADQTDKTFFPDYGCSKTLLFCKSGQDTKCREKVDYIFFSKNGTSAGSGLSGGVVATSSSNHDVVRGRADFTW